MTILSIGLSFDSETSGLGIAGLNFNTLSRFFNFQDGSWHAHVGGVAYDNLVLISSPCPLEALIFTNDFDSNFISKDIGLFSFKKITNKALKEWGFKESFLEENDYEHENPILNWEDVPEDPAFKTVCIHDDYFVDFFCWDLSLVKKLIIFAVNECALFVHGQPHRLLSPELEEDFLKCFLSTEGGEIIADKSKATLTYSFKVKSKSSIKRLFHIRDIVKKEISF